MRRGKFVGLDQALKVRFFVRTITEGLPLGGAATAPVSYTHLDVYKRQGKYRINGVVVNMPEFGAAFSCKAGQPMVKPPEKVCHVW